MPHLPALTRTRLVALLAQAAVLTTVVAGLVAFAGQHRALTLTVQVDGQARQLQTRAHTVGAALTAAGLSPGPHDEVVPDPASPVANHDTIVLRHGRLVMLTLEGQTRPLWTTATSVAQVLAGLGLTDSREYVSASRSRLVGLAGMALTVRVPAQVELVADGKARTVTTTRATVREVLVEAHLKLGPKDTLSVPATRFPADGLVVRVTRIGARQEIDSQVIPRTTHRVADASLYVGQSRVLDDGQDGVIRLVYAVKLVDHRPAGRTLQSRTQTAPMRPRVVAYGTRPVPPPPPPSYSSGSGLNWQALANCESGGNPRAVSSDGTYRGLYQFSMSTWQGVGGSGDPIDASVSEQTYRAQILYSRSGRSAWPVCGQYL